jgi:hypothetical protein
MVDAGLRSVSAFKLATMRPESMSSTAKLAEVGASRPVASAWATGAGMTPVEAEAADAASSPAAQQANSR